MNGEYLLKMENMWSNFLIVIGKGEVLFLRSAVGSGYFNESSVHGNFSKIVHEHLWLKIYDKSLITKDTDPTNTFQTRHIC